MILKCLCTHLGCVVGVPIKKILFLFTDFLRFYPFVQNHCYSIKLKAILYKFESLLNLFQSENSFLVVEHILTTS